MARKPAKCKAAMLKFLSTTLPVGCNVVLTFLADGRGSPLEATRIPSSENVCSCKILIATRIRLNLHR